MKKEIIVLVVFMFFSVLCCLACAGQKETGLSVFVSIIPQSYLVERIGGRHVDVETLVGEGQSPATYEPSPQQMAKLSFAKIYFTIGVPFEKNVMKKIKQAHRKLVIVETQNGVAYRYLENHPHDAEEETVGLKLNRMPDPHIWMDPKLVKVQARNIHDALCKFDPVNAMDYSANLNALMTDIDRTDKRITTVLAPLKGSKIYVFHPAFGYFADSYGLRQVPVEIEGKEPGAKQLASLINKAKKDGIRVIFVQPQFSTKSAKTIANAIGGVVVPINPLAGDYLANLERIASEISKGLTR